MTRITDLHDVTDDFSLLHCADLNARTVSENYNQVEDTHTLARTHIHTQAGTRVCTHARAHTHTHTQIIYLSICHRNNQFIGQRQKIKDHCIGNREMIIALEIEMIAALKCTEN